MAYSTSPTFTPGTELAAADLNQLGDNITYLKAQTDLAVLSGTLVTRTTNQSISNNSYTDVTFTTEVFDQGGWIAVSATTITVPASAIPPGYTTVALDIRPTAQFASNATGKRSAIVTQSGTTIISASLAADSSSNTDIPLTSTLVSAVVGDTFKLSVYQNSGGSLNLVAARLVVAVYRPIS